MVEKKLYHVQDADRPMYVVASSFQEALDTWTAYIAGENDMKVEDVEGPNGVSLICNGGDLIV